MARLPRDAFIPVVIWPYNQGDVFFTGSQQARLADLKSRRNSLTDEERKEWEELLEASFEATIARYQFLPLVKSRIHTSF